MTVDETVVWLDGALPDPPAPPPDPRAYIAELEEEVAFARQQLRGDLADRLRMLLAARRREDGPRPGVAAGVGARADQEQG
jgi:hypothetical protein